MQKKYQLQKASCEEQHLMTDIPSAIWTTFLISVTADKLLVPVTHKSAIITFFSTLFNFTGRCWSQKYTKQLWGPVIVWYVSPTVEDAQCFHNQSLSIYWYFFNPCIHKLTEHEMSCMHDRFLLTVCSS